MNTTILRHARTLALATTTLLAATGAAQAEGISTSFYKSYGDADIASCYVSADASADRQFGSTSSISADAHASGGVSIFGENLEAFRFDADASMSVNSSYAYAGVSGYLRLGFYTYFDEERSVSLSLGETFGPFAIVEVDATFWVGPVPLTVGGEAGVGAELGSSIGADLAAHSVTVTPSARGWIYGEANAGLGIPGFSVGVLATLNFADTTVSYSPTVDLESGLSGSLSLSITPVMLILSLYAELDLWFWSERWTLPLATWFMMPLTETHQLH